VGRRRVFRGTPMFAKMLPSVQQLSPEEQAFLDGPCDELCKMIDRYRSRARAGPRAHPRYLRAGFFGLLIPKEYAARATRCCCAGR